MYNKEIFDKIANLIAFFYIFDGVTILMFAILFISLSFSNLPYAPSFSSLLGYYPSTIYILIFNIILGISSVIVGFGLLARTHLSRVGAIILAIPKLISVPVGTVLGIFIIIFMVMPYTNKIFGAFSHKKLPYRVIGIFIIAISFFAFTYLNGSLENTYQTMSIKMNGYPECNINPMEKIKINPNDLYGEQDVIVELTAPVGTYAYSQQNEIIQDVENLGGYIEDRYFYSLNAMHIKIDANNLKELAKNPYVKAIYPNYKVKLYIGNITEVHALKDCDALLNTNWLWSHGYTGKGAVVAIIDAGINEDMKWLQRNGNSVVIASYEKYGDYLLDPEYHISHGTLVASSIASQNLTYRGVAPDASLVDVEVFQKNDTDMWATVSDILWGYEKVVEFKNEHPNYFVIASCSFGIPAELIGDTWSNPHPISQGANNLAVKYGIPVVASAGNDADKGYHISAPASAQYVLAVGALDKTLSPAYFSSEGPTPDGHRKPDVSNIGVDVALYDYDGTLKFVSGTSFSCPLTSGIIADLATKNKDLKPTDFYLALEKSAKDVYLRGFDYKTGYGFVDAVKASQIIGKITPTSTYVAISFVGIFFGAGIVFYPEWGGKLWRKKK